MKYFTLLLSLSVLTIGSANFASEYELLETEVSIPEVISTPEEPAPTPSDAPTLDLPEPSEEGELTKEEETEEVPLTEQEKQYETLAPITNAIREGNTSKALELINKADAATLSAKLEEFGNKTLLELAIEQGNMHGVQVVQALLTKGVKPTQTEKNLARAKSFEAAKSDPEKVRIYNTIYRALMEAQ